MRKCKWCGKSGWFLSLSKEGFCQSCESNVRTEIVQATQSLNESLTLMRRSKDVDLRLNKSQVAIQKLRELVPFYERGLVSLRPSPQEWVAHIYQAVREIVNKHVSNSLESATKQARLLREPTEKVKLLTEVLDVVTKYEIQLGKVNTLRWKKRIESEIGYLLNSNEVERGESKDTERTLSHYHETLAILQADFNGDPDQAHQIEKIKKLIKDLGGDLTEGSQEKLEKVSSTQENDSHLPDQSS